MPHMYKITDPLGILTVGLISFHAALCIWDETE